MENNNLRINQLSNQIKALVKESRDDLLASIMLPVAYAFDQKDGAAMSHYQQDGRLTLFFDHSAKLPDMEDDELMQFFDQHKEYVVETFLKLRQVGQINMSDGEHNQHIININQRYAQYKSLQTQLTNLTNRRDHPKDRHELLRKKPLIRRKTLLQHNPVKHSDIQ